MKLVLYHAPRACSVVPFVTLTEARAPFDIVTVNLAQREHLGEAYLRINPKHKVPVLAIDGDALTENVAIQIWIARTFPHARLMPADPAREIKAIAFLAWCASSLHPALTPNAHPLQYCDLPGTEDGVRRAARAKLFEHYAIADAMLAGNDWLFDHFTAADAYFFWCFRRGLQFDLDLSRFAACQAHQQRMQQRPSVQRALAWEAEALAARARAAAAASAGSAGPGAR